MSEFEDLPGYRYDDGGRAAAGYKGTTGDCGVRATAIATGKPYAEVYDALFAIAKNWKGNSRKAQRIRARATPRTGVNVDVLDAYMQSIGWHATMVKSRLHELPAWAYTQVKEGVPGAVLYMRKHYTALVDDTVRDIWDCRMASAVVTDDDDVIPPKPKHITRIWTPAS